MRGSGTQASPYLIGSAEEWNEIAVLKQVNTWVEIDNDIDFKDKEFKSLWLISSRTSGGGHFLGNNHTIKNIEVNGTTDGLIITDTALNVNYAEIRDITFDNIKMALTTIYDVALIGNAATIENVKIKGLNIVSGGKIRVLSGTTNPSAKQVSRCMIQGRIQAPNVEIIWAAGISIIQCYEECEVYLTSNQISYGMANNTSNVGYTLMSFCRNHWYNATGTICDIRPNGGAVQCYSSTQYTNCTGTIYPCERSRVACFYNKDFTEGLTVEESGCEGITTEQMKDRSFFEGKGWVFVDEV